MNRPYKLQPRLSYGLLSSGPTRFGSKLIRNAAMFGFTFGMRTLKDPDAQFDITKINLKKRQTIAEILIRNQISVGEGRLQKVGNVQRCWRGEHNYRLSSHHGRSEHNIWGKHIVVRIQTAIEIRYTWCTRTRLQATEKHYATESGQYLAGNCGDALFKKLMVVLEVQSKTGTTGSASMMATEAMAPLVCATALYDTEIDDPAPIRRNPDRSLNARLLLMVT